MTFAAFDHVYGAACALLPQRMNTREAQAMIFAIGLQESRFEHRSQLQGPARSFFQFEPAGIKGVLTHPASERYIRDVLDALCYDHQTVTSYEAIEHNDVLACCYARLLLWTLPWPLPVRDQYDEGWRQYNEAWRPGKPHRQTWTAFYLQAWALADERHDIPDKPTER